MPLYLVNGEKMRVNFQNEPASVISYPAFPGSTIRKFQSETANLLIKEIISDLFTIRYKVFQFPNKQMIESDFDTTGILSRVMLQNDLHLNVDTIGPINQKEGTVCLLSGHGAHCSATLEASLEYRSLDIYAGQDLASQLAHFFPQVELDFNRLHNLFPFPCFISPGLHKVIDEILDCSYDEKTSRFYFDVKIREYFYLLLQDCLGAHKIHYRFTPFEIDQLQKAHDVLLSDLSKPPLTIRELARHAGMNEFKLKAGFMHFFKTGVFECFQRARMHKAKQLLLQTNKPLKEICTMTGYPRMTNFITAFRKFFGYTPGSLRRS